MSPVPAPPEPPVPNLVRIQIVFSDYTNLPENRYVNTWHFLKPTAMNFSDAADQIMAPAGALVPFYNSLNGGATQSVGSTLASFLSRTVIWHAYDMSVAIPPARIPRNGQFTLVNSSIASNMPGEVAMVASFSGANAGVPRQRGRLFLGPFNTNVNNSGSATAYAQPASTAVIAAVNSMAAVRAYSAISTNPVWCVYSRANDNTVPVVKGYVDNAFDTQRRRGNASTARTTWGIV